MQSNQEWNTAKELAGMPGMPGTERGVRDKAKREGWQTRTRKGRGGGREYHIDSLPEETRQALLDQMIENLPEKICPLPTKVSTAVATIQKKNLPPETSLAHWQRRTMEARLALLNHIERLTVATSVNKAVDRIVALGKAGELPEHLQQLVPIANARSGGDFGKQTLSRRTLFRWRSDLQNLGIVALAPREPARKGMPEWGPALLKLWRQPQKPTLTDAVNRLIKQDVDVNYGQARRFLQKLGEVEKAKGRMGPREIKNVKPFRRRDTSNLLPGDIYAADGHCFDAEVAHPDHGRPFRPEITLMIDVCSRRVVGWSVSLAESTLATIDALRMACEQIGPPAILYCDNGSGYKNELMTAPGTGFMARLGIEMKHSIPYNSQARGIIERVHRSILVKAAKRLPTYIGAPMDRQAKQAAFKETRSTRQLLIDWADFVRLINAAIDEYHMTPHSGLPSYRNEAGKKIHYAPMEFWDAKVCTDLVVPANELPDLYHPQVQRKVDRGEVRLYGKIYYSNALKEWHGDDVLVGYNMHNADKVWVRNEDQRLICEAVLDGNKSDFMPLSEVERGRDKRMVGRLKRIDLKRDEIEAERYGALPPGTIEVSAEAQELRKELAVEMAQADNVVEIPHDPRGKDRLWRQLEQRMARGETPSEKEQIFFKGFQKTRDWQIFREVEKDLAIAK